MPAVRAPIKIAFFLACLITLAAAYFNNTPLPLFLTRIRQFALALAVLCSAGGWGSQILRISFLRAGPLTSLENMLFMETLGLGALSTGMIGLGTLHLWVPFAGWALVIAGIALSKPFFAHLKQLMSLVSSDAPPLRETLIPSLALWTGGILSLVFALAPITYYDSLVYHFALPAAYLRVHHWVPLSNLIYSAFPQTMEMLWTLGLLVGDDTVANLIGWGISAVLIIAVIAFGRRFLDASVGLIAAALLAVMPAFLLLSSGGYIDIGLTLFSFMALYAACVWDQGLSRGALVISGLFVGLAMGAKYTGGLPALLITIFLSIRLWRQGGSREVRAGLLRFLGSAVLIFSPWLIKNTLFVGNPVFPFLYQLGLKTLNPWINDAAAGYFAGITEYFSRPVWTLPSVLWEAAVNGITFGRGIDVLGDYGWLPLISLLPGLWLCRQRPYHVRLLLIFCAGFFALWAMSRPVLRFLLPISPLLALLAAYAWVHGVRPLPARARGVSQALVGLFVLSGMFLFFFTARVISPFDVALGLESRRMYLSRMLDYYAAAEFINTQTPADSRVYILGDQRGYYYERHVIITPVFSKNPFTEWSNGSDSPRTLHARLKEEGITHIVVNRNEWDRLQKGYPTLRFNTQGRTNWENLSSQLKPLYRDRACDIYAL